MEQQSEIPRAPILSLLKALDIIAAFTPQDPVLSLAEISERLSLPKATTYNILATLRSRAYIEKTDDGRYSLGRGVIPLTQCVRVNVQVRDRAAPLLRALAQEIHESVYLTVPDGDYALYIYGVESAHRLLARTAVGDRVYLHCTAVGKAYLASLSREAVEAIAGRVGLTRFTSHTLTTLPDLYAELALTRERGYSLDQQEHELHTFCVGAGICDDSGRVIAACSTSGSDPEIVGARLPALSSLVAGCADDISRRMGYVAPRASVLSLRAAEQANGSQSSNRRAHNANQ